MAKKPKTTKETNADEPFPTRQDVIDDVWKVATEHDLITVTRDFLRKNSKLTDRDRSRYFNTHQELLATAGLYQTREARRINTERKKASESEWLSEYAETEILPYHDIYRKTWRPKEHIRIVLTCSDLHCFDCDPFALRTFIDTCKLMQPHDIVFNGDLADMYWFSSYQKDRRTPGWKISKQWMDNLFTATREACPKSNIHYIPGNHDLRSIRWHADRSPETLTYLHEYCEMSLEQFFGIHKHKINFLCKLGLGAFTNSEVRHQLNQNYLVLYDSWVANHERDDGYKLSGTNGHHHKITYNTFNILDHAGKVKSESWVQTGMMAYIDAHFLKGMTPWQQGFLITHIDTRTNEVVQKPIHIQQNFCEVNGKIYTRRKSESIYRPR